MGSSPTWAVRGKELFKLVVLPCLFCEGVKFLYYTRQNTLGDVITNTLLQSPFICHACPHSLDYLSCPTFSLDSS